MEINIDGADSYFVSGALALGERRTSFEKNGNVSFRLIPIIDKLLTSYCQVIAKLLDDTGLPEEQWLDKYR